MQRTPSSIRSKRGGSRLLGFVTLIGATLATFGGPRAATESSPIYTLEVSDVTAKVGEPAVMTARLKLHDGYQVLHAYSHHVSQLSSYDDGVAFDHKWVTAADQDGTLVFAIDVRSTKPGSHPINGVLRFGYIESGDQMSMISVPLMAKVIGTN